VSEPVQLDLLPPMIVRRRAVGVVGLALVLAAAAGGIVGLFGGRGPGLLAAAVVGVPLVLLATAEARRRTRLVGSVVEVRGIGVRRVDLARPGRRDLLVSEVRGQRTVSLLLSEAGGPTVTVALALYTASGGVELNVLALRRLADALAKAGTVGSPPAASDGRPDSGDDDEARAATSEHARVLSGLLVGQLRAEARGAVLRDRPLWLVTGLVEAGRVVRKVSPRRLAGMVAEFC
jgi:hypothetical protein